MSVVRVSSTGEGSAPYTAAGLRAHVGSIADDDSQLTSMALAAREYIETRTNRSLVPNTLYRLTLDAWPGRTIELPRSPLTSSTSVAVKYTPNGGAQQTVSTSSYVVDGDSEPPRVVLARDATWPDAELQSAKAIEVTWRAGSTSVPQRAKHAIKMLADLMYEHRGEAPAKLPDHLEALVWSLKVPA